MSERDPVREYYRKNLDLSLVRETAALSVEERLIRLMEMQKLAEELARDRERSSREPATAPSRRKAGSR